MRTFLILVLTFLALPAFAEGDRMVKIDTRPGVTVSFYYMKRPGATATVALLTGGAGGIGTKNGVPTSSNFLVRSRDLFAARGFNVAVVGKPSDKNDLDGSFRISPEHVADLRQVVAYLKKDAGVPVWLVGTSMGTISATAAAISLGPGDLAGIVLTSSVTAQGTVGAVPWQPLEKVRVPVMVLHHELDACRICVPGDVDQIMSGLTNAKVKKAVYVKGGADPKGDPCQPLHWHGFIGMEQEAVDIIAGWIKAPAP